MGYVSASRGFQSGGWNLQTPQNPAFGPETLDDFEAGLKYADRSRRFRADANVFYYDYSDLQVSALTPIGQATTNATSAEIYGLELQLDARLGRRTDVTLRGAASAGAVQALPQRDLHQFQRRRGHPLCADNLRRHRQPPSLRAQAQVQCRRQPPSSRWAGAGTLVLSGNLAYNSGYFAEPDNVVRQDAFATRRCVGGMAARSGAARRSGCGCSISPMPTITDAWRPCRPPAFFRTRRLRGGSAPRSAMLSRAKRHRVAAGANELGFEEKSR